MVVTVLGAVRLGFKRFATVFGNMQRGVHLVNAAELVRAGKYFLVIMWSCSAGKVITALLPIFPAI